MCPQGFVKPANQVLVAGNPIVGEYEVGAAATAAKMLPGILVIFDGTDSSVKEGGAKADNVVGILDVAPDKLEADHYAVGDQARIIMGECIAKLTLLANENVTRGDPLVSAADGKVAKQAAGVMGATGSVIGWALESSNVTVDAEILVHYQKCAEPPAVS